MPHSLLLKDESLVDSVAKLFARLKNDRSLQVGFIKSPASVIDGRHPPSEGEDRSAVNEFIYFLIADPRFKRWLERYRNNPITKTYKANQIMRDLTRAFAKYGAARLRSRSQMPVTTDIVIASSISRTYIRTLNNSTTFITKIKVDDPPQRQDLISPMQIVSMAEQLFSRNK